VIIIIIINVVVMVMKMMMVKTVLCYVSPCSATQAQQTYKLLLARRNFEFGGVNLLILHNTQLLLRAYLIMLLYLHKL